MRTRRHRSFLLFFSLFLVTLSLVLAACGSGQGSNNTGTTATSGCKTSYHASVASNSAPVTTQLASFSEGYHRTAGAATKLKNVSIGLGYIPNIQFAPYYVAQSKGYYQAAGLNVTFHHGFVNDLIGSMVLGHDNFVWI